MKIFDFNIHLPFAPDKSIAEVINSDMNLDANSVGQGLAFHAKTIQKTQGANFLLFNTKLFDEDTQSVFSNVSRQNYNAAFTALVDFRRSDILSYVERAKSAGIKAIMFNSYLQQVSDADFADVYKVCRFAEEKRLIICIDGSYGTAKMKTYDNIKLACFIADLVSKAPIVIVHSGGFRVIEAMLLADSCPNVWLDTSFSLPYYIGSSIENDYAFAYKKIGTHRVVFGSDHPYKNFDEALHIHQSFFAKHKFTETQQDDIFYNNSLQLFSL